MDSKLTNKEILISYINTLDDKDCKRIYLWAKDEVNMLTKDYLWFDLQGNQVQENWGNIVKLTPIQYYKLIYMWGEDKSKDCISLLASWISKKNEEIKVSHYQLLNGWVERYYHKFTKEQSKELDSFVNFASIKTIEGATHYISNTPPLVRDTCVYCSYLVNKFGTKILEV